MIARKYSPQNNFALLGIGHHFLECHGKLMSFQIHLSRADPSEAGVDQRAHLMGRRQLAGFQEIGEFACTFLDGHLRTSFALASTNQARPRPGQRQNGFQVDWGVNFK
jgi:hypothetical protein